MPEVSTARPVSPADRTVTRQPAEYRVKTTSSSNFAELLHGPFKAAHPACRPVVHHEPARAPQSSEEPGRGRAQAPTRRHAEDPLARDSEEAKSALDVPLDPLFCQLAVNHTLGSAVQPSPAVSSPPAALPLRDDVQNLLAGLARRAAWGGDRRKGSARIELSEGALAGATLVVHTEERTVSVELELPAGVAGGGWQQRIAERLEGRGFAARVKVG